MSGFDGLLSPGLLPRSPRLIGEASATVEPRSAVAVDFAATLNKALHDLEHAGDEPHDKAMALVRGEPVQVHDVLVSMGKAEVAFNLALEVRNRLLQAWETLSRSVL